MKQLFMALLLAFMSGTACAQGLQLQWIRGITGTDDVDSGPVALDAQKNLYIGGSFKGTADFDPGPGTAMLSTTTGFARAGAYLAKYDASGGYVFAHKLADFGHLAITALVLDVNGNICLTGIFDSTVDFDPGPGTANMTSAGSLDIFVARYTSGGAYINAFRIGGSGIDGADDLATDWLGNLYITGDFRGTADFDPSPGTINLVSAGDGDVFLAKYSGTGVYDFAFRMGGSNLDGGSSIVVDGSGNVYVGGNFVTSMDLDPGSGTAIVSGPGINGFFAKYGPTGSYQTGFAYDLGTVNEVALDAAGDIYLAGRFQDSLDADPGAGIARLYSVNGNDTYLSKLDAGGNYIHATALRNNGGYIMSGIGTNHRSAVYLYGSYSDTLYFDPISSTGSLSSVGFSDAFLVKFGAGGSFSHSTSFGSTGSDVLRSLAQDGQGDIWISGYFNNTVDFDPSGGTADLMAASGFGLFIGRYKDPEAGVGIPRSPGVRGRPAVFGGDDRLYLDFSALDRVDAEIRVTDMTGRTVATVRHSRRDMLKLDLPGAAPRVYVVIVRNGGQVTAEKVFVR